MYTPPKLNGTPRIKFSAPKIGEPQSLPQVAMKPLVLPSAATISTNLMGMGDIFRTADLAFQTDRTLQRQMRNDPDVNAPLEQRILATALQEWEIVPSQEFQGDQAAIDEASALQQAILRTPYLTQLRRWLVLGCWWGHSGVNVVYGEPRHEVKVGGAKISCSIVNWLPVHPDSIVFDVWGNVAIKLNPSEMARRGQPVPESQIVGTEMGRGMRLDNVQRKCLILNRVGLEGADFEVTAQAATPLSGRGLRWAVWWTWWLKQKALQNMETYMERLAKGTMIGTYPEGNEQAKVAMQNVIVNCLTDAGVTIPRVSGSPEDYSLTILEASGRAWQLFRDTIQDYFVDQLTKSIIGQSLTMNSESTGLGSGVAVAHMDSFERIMRYDAACLDDTMTQELVAVMHKANFPDSKYRHEYRTLVDRANPGKIMDAAKAFVDMGGTLPEDALREKLALPMIEEGDKIIGGTRIGMPLGDDGAPMDPNLEDFATPHRLNKFMRG